MWGGLLKWIVPQDLKVAHAKSIGSQTGLKYLQDNSSVQADFIGEAGLSTSKDR